MTQFDTISVKHLSKQFKNQTALKDISFNIQPGEIFGFLGPSGAGKTTTIKILTGQMHPSDGVASVLGVPTEKINEHIYEQVGIVTHNSGLYDKLSVYKNLEIFTKILNVKKSKIEEILKQVGLFKDRKKIAGKLSQGMRQRLILARAVIHNPKVLFLDEPTSGLDPSTQVEIHRLIKSLRDNGTAVFLTTHNMEEAEKLCDHLALLNNGKIVEAGTHREIRLNHNKKKRYKVLLKDGKEFILSQSEETTQKINWWMTDNELVTIHSCEPTLETVFLEVTGRKLI